MKNSLGRYQGASGEVIAERHFGKIPAIMQLYSEGTICDLTQTPRKTMVRAYSCVAVHSCGSLLIFLCPFDRIALTVFRRPEILDCYPTALVSLSRGLQELHCWSNFCLMFSISICLRLCVQVRYECAPDVFVATLKDVQEVSTCVYEAVILTNVVCDHPALAVSVQYNMRSSIV